MTLIEQRLIKEAEALGACDLIKDANSLEDLAKLFMSAQGREFCLKNDFPKKSDFYTMRSYHVAKYGIFVDYGTIESKVGGQTALIGKTHGQLYFSGNEAKHIVTLMHGADATIYLSNYAVVKVEKTPDCEVTIKNEDNTGVVLW